MPVTYYSSTGIVSFDPVAPRDQAVGPIGVALAPSPPDEIIAPQGDGNATRFQRYRAMVLVLALTAMGALLATAYPA